MIHKCCFLACFCASQRVQRRKAKLTLAQIREKLPNGWADWHQIWHTCANSYWNGYTPNKLPLETQGAFRRSTKFSKVLGSCPIGTNFGSRLRIHLGMDIDQIQVTPQYPRGHFGGGGKLGCHKFKSLGKLSNGWTNWPQIWHTSADPSGNGYTPNKLPLETQRGHLGGFRGQTFKRLGKLSNGCTDWHQLWFTSADSSGNGHRLNPSHPSIPQGAFRGG